MTEPSTGHHLGVGHRRDENPVLANDIANRRVSGVVKSVVAI